MSKVALQGNASGTGTLTVAAANTNSDYTLTLPAETGTVLTSGGAIDVNASAPADSLAISSAGNVGIGTTSPLAKFEVHGQSRFASSASSAVLLIDSDATSTNGVNLQSSYYGGAGYGPMKFSTGGTERMRIDSSGYLYVNNMAVGGTANMHWSSANGQFFVTSSSRRFKHDIVDYDKGLAQVMQMQPKYFVYNEEPNQKQRVGFIAEDFHDLGMTEFVEYWKDENNQDIPSEIGYSNMVAICVKAIQELKAENDALKSRLDAVEALEARIAALEAGNVNS